MGKYSLFLKNLSALALGQFSSKIIVFFMVPFYTTYLSASDYGSYDFINTMISLSIPIFVVNIHTAVLRFTVNNDYNSVEVFHNAWIVNILGIICFTCMIFINYLTGVSDILSKYGLETVLLFAATTTYFILSEYLRGLGQVKNVAISGIINTVSVVTLNIVFLSVARWGLNGFILSSVLGFLIASAYLILKIKNVTSLFKCKYRKKTLMEMIKFSFPLIFNSLSWWANGVAGRYIIIATVGIATNGIYAVSYSIVSIFVVLQGIFDQAWVISALKEFKSSYRDDFYIKMYRLYNFFLIHVCLFIFIALHELANFLFKGEFINAWIYVPLLTIAALFGALSGFIGVVFSAVKKTKEYAKTTIVGAVVNLMLSGIFVVWYGAIGATLSALISGIFIWIFRIYYARKYVDICWIECKNVLAYLLLVFQAIILINIPVSIYLYESFAFSFIVLVFLYWNQYTALYNKVKSFL